MIPISEVNEIINGIIDGDKDMYIEGPCSISNGKKGFLSYIKSGKYLKYLNTTLASAIIVDQNITLPDGFNKTIIKVENAPLAFLKFLDFYKNLNNRDENIQIHNSSIIHDTATLGKEVCIGENVIIEEKVEIYSNVTIGANTIIKKYSRIGENTNIKSNVVISSNSIIGKNCKIKSGSIIGESGFGLFTDKDKKHHEIPHIGKVIIKDDVLIGGNCTIDKGTIDDTIIGNGTKFDNLVHIGHNVIIGDNCLICAQVGIGGSTKIDNHVIVGGQTGIIDNLLINENVIIGPKSYVIKSIEENTYVSGNPARNHRDHVKQDILISKLPEIYKKITK